MKKVLFMLLVNLSLFARAQIRDTISVLDNEVDIELDDQGYHHIVYGSNYVIEAGAPELPLVTKHYYIPHGATDVQLSAMILDERQKEGTYNVYPSQGLVPISQRERTFIGLSDKWSNRTYPTTYAEIVSDNRIMGYRVLTVCYYPFVYEARNGLLTMRDISISLEYTIGVIPQPQTLQSSYRKNKCKEYIKGIVENPDLLEETFVSDSASPYSREVPIRLFGEGCPIPDFIIITNEELKPVFKPLAEWKTRRGIYTIIETTEYIDSVCSGADLCEKIRNYIKEKEECWGEGLAILLGGGIDIIPARTFMGTYGHEVTDLYYIHNGDVMPNQYNNFYTADFNSTIGRFPVDNIEEAKNLVMKNLAYEWAEKSGVDYNYVNNTLVASSYLGTRDGNFVGGYMSTCYNYVINTPNKNHWFLFDFFNQCCSGMLGNVSYLLSYTKTGIEGQGEEMSRESLLGALSNGRDSINHFHFVYHMDHSGPFSIGSSQFVKGESITTEDVAQLDCATDYYQIILSGGCHPADFSTSCVAKSFLMKPMSSAVAFMGNTDVGWETEHFALDVFYKTMYGNVKWDWETRIDNVWKSYVMDTRCRNPKSRFHILGDPTLTFWNQTPRRYQNRYTMDNLFLTVTRPNELVGIGSTVCIYKEDEVYMIDTLCVEKEQVFYLQDIKTSGYVYITTTGIGQIPQRDSLYFDMKEENLLGIDRVELIRNNNREDSILSPGETFNLKVTYKALKNNVPSRVILRTEPVEDNLYIECLSPNVTIGQMLQQGDTCQHSFAFKISNDIPNMSKHNKNGLELELSYSNNVQNSLGRYVVDIIKPDLFIHSVETNSISGNLYDVKIGLSTNGVAPFVGEIATFTSTDNLIAVEDSVKNFTVSLNQGNVGELVFRVNNLSSETNNIICVLSVHDVYGNTYSYTISPFVNRPQPPSVYNVSFYSGADYIDIVGNFSQINCTTTGETFNVFKSTQGKSFFRHESLEAMKTYQYKLKRREIGLESTESTIRSCTTKIEALNNFPNVVEHSSAFRGLINAWDVDRDGKQEVFGTTWDYLDNNGSLVAVRASGEDLFNDKDNHIIETFAPTQGNFMSGVAIGELYDDGEQYIVSATYNDKSNTVNSVYCYKTADDNGDGFPDLHWKKDSVLINSPCSPIIADLEGDNICEVIVPSRGNIIIFEANGEIRKVIANLGNSYKQPAVANVIPDSKGKQLIVPDGKNLNVYNSNGVKQSNYCVSLSAIASSPVICDYDDDGYKEAIVGDLIEKDTKDYKNRLDSIYIYSIKYGSTGVSKKKLFGYTRHLSGRIDAPFMVGDLDSNKKLEIISISHSASNVDSLVRFDESKVTEKKKSARLTSENMHHNSMVLLDYDGDLKKDIVIPGGKKNNKLIGVKNMGNYFLERDLSEEMYSDVSEGMMASDIDNDGFVEIICGTSAGRLYVWKTKGSPDLIEWGSCRANPQNTGEYGKIIYPKLAKNESYSEPYTIDRDFYVVGNVTFSDTVSVAPQSKIVVWGNGVLNIDGAIFDNARIIVKPNGKINLTNGGIIKPRDKNSFVISKGGLLRITNGKITN